MDKKQMDALLKEKHIKLNSELTNGLIIRFNQINNITRQKNYFDVDCFLYFILGYIEGINQNNK